MTPEACDCSGPASLARAYDELVEKGVMTTPEAIDQYGSDIDYDCRGKKPNTDPLIVGCGSPEKICGHRKGPGYLIQRTLEIREVL